MSVKIALTGVKEIDNVLKAMPVELADKTMQSAGLAAAKPLVDRAKEIVPKGKTRNLVNSIGAYRSSFKHVTSGRRNVGEVSAGPRRGKFKGYAAHLIEYGTAVRFARRRNGKRLDPPANRGRVTSSPFMKPAFDQTRPLILGTYNTILSKRIVSLMKRTLKK